MRAPPARCAYAVRVIPTAAHFLAGAPRDDGRACTRSRRALRPNRRAERILVVLRDGRKIIGVLRSFDQFCARMRGPCTSTRASEPSARRECVRPRSRAAYGQVRSAHLVHARALSALRRRARACCLSAPANVVLESSVERIVVESRFADLPLGLYVVRGENIVLLGPLVRKGEALGEGAGAYRRPLLSCCTTPRAFVHTSAKPERHSRTAAFSRLLSAQDEDKEANLQNLTRVEVDEILAAKRAAEEAERLKGELAKQLRTDWFRDDQFFD